MSEQEPMDAQARAEASLAAFFAEDGLAERDPAFSATVVEEIARRRFRANLLELAGVAALAALVLWALWQAVSADVAAIVSGAGPAALAAVVLASLYVGLKPLFRRA
ncbi:hypothetical protein [Caulobacter mirabilis]|uniref:hypothetical protein n=1 Tax=Caulobacter mirabilis TaxID=69666 RepID=UPI001558BC32|nr:hypothetical protein [Caulobacter mirabilis]